MKKLLFLLLSVAVLALGCTSTENSESPGSDTVSAASKTSERLTSEAEIDGYEVINAVIVGDRVLDISASLGIMPKVIAVRASQWPKAKTFPAKLVGCPVCVTVKKPETLPNAINQMSIDTVIVEKNPNFCMLMKSADPTKVSDVLTNVDVNIETIDFSQGQDQAIRWIAKLYGKEAEGEALIDKIHKETAEAESRINETVSGKKVVILNGVVKKETGRLFISAESKGFYTDRFFIDPFKCENIGDILNKDENQITKGYFPVTNLRLLADANPDVIILFGAAEALKEKINALASQKESIANIPAVKNGNLVQLPYYVGSDIEDYPAILTTWIDYFASLK